MNVLGHLRERPVHEATGGPDHYVSFVTDPTPTVFLLAGLPGSGKSTYARRLEADGVVRVSVDAEMMSRHGRIGVDYPADAHVRLLGPVLAWASERLIAEVRGGASVVFDHGLGNRRDREELKRIVESAGATWRLVVFREEVSTLLQRLARRQGEDPCDSMPITPEMLAYLASVYEEPSEEGEELATW